MLVALGLSLAALVAMIPLWLSQAGRDPKADGNLASSFNLVLARPALAQGGPGFPDGEAGMSAYIKFPAGSVNTDNLVRDLFTGMTLAGANYVIGQFSEPRIAVNGAGYMRVELTVYADADGWLVAYLPKTRLVSEILYRNYPDSPEPDQDWKSVLARALGHAATVAGAAEGRIDEGSIGYYHWGFPSANRIALALRAGNRKLYFALPTGSVLSDLSAAIACQNNSVSLALVGPNAGQVVACSTFEYVSIPFLDTLPNGLRSDPNDGHQVGEVGLPGFLPGTGPTKGVVHALVGNTGESYFGGVAIVYEVP
ncbi:MAG: hypothetical protein HY683_09540 [Chloroflexi bacterium]|nr:hypothetical protein [Chloroflexota bacterium]